MTHRERLHAQCGSAAVHAHAGARPFALPSSTKHFERALPFRTKHLALALTLDFEEKSVEGRATLTLERLDPEATGLDLDAVGFRIAKVTSSGKAVEWSYDGKVLRLVLGKKFKEGVVAIDYRAVPRRGMYFLEPDEHVPNRPKQVWTQCQESDARHFIPCHDEPHVKLTADIAVTVPSGVSVLSNGKLVEKKTPKTGPWSFHWKMDDPLPTYLLTIVAGEFTELTDEADGVALSYWIPKGRDADGKRTFKNTPDMMRLFGEVTGVRYPWNKYAQIVVSDFIFGGMENTTATTLYEYTLLDERAAIDVTSDDLIAHELAHHWFGDYVTCRDWSEGWLNEGFATYFEHVFREKKLGADEYAHGITGDLDAYLDEARGRYKRPIVCRTYDTPLDLFDRHLYEKGGQVLHLLRMELGDALFWKGVNLYLTRHAHGSVETRDLARAFEEVSGRSLGRFFDQWVYQPGHPEAEIEIAYAAGALTVSVKQTQAATDGVPSAFEFPLELLIRDDKGSDHEERLFVRDRNESFSIPCAKRPQFVVIDPRQRILGDVSLKAPNDLLHGALAKAPSARGRTLAAKALHRADDPVTLEALEARLMDEKEFWGVRAAAAEAIATLKSREAQATLIAATKVKHSKVRRAVAAGLGGFKNAASIDALRPLALSDESYLVVAESARALGRTRQAGAYDVLVDLLDRPSWADLVQSAAVTGLAGLKDERALHLLLAKTRYGHPMRTRRAAVASLPKLVHDRRGREILEDLVGDRELDVRLAAVQALLDLGDPRARGALHAQIDVELDARVKRRIREVLRDLGGETKRSLEHLKEDFEKLRDELLELRRAVKKLDPKKSATQRVRQKASKGAKKK